MAAAAKKPVPVKPVAAKPFKKGVAVKPMAPNAVLNLMIEMEDAEDAVESMLQLILGRANQQIRKNAIERTALLSTAAETIENLIQAVELDETMHDPGEEEVDEPPADGVSQHLWTAEPEPEPCPIDRWARGVLAVRPQAQPQPQQQPAEQSAAAAPPPFVRTHSVANSSVAGARPRKTERPSPAPAPVTLQSIVAATPVSPPVEVPRPVSASDVKREKLRQSELMRLTQRTQQQQEIARKLQAEAESAAKMETLKQKLKGQNYFFDPMGNVVVVRKPAAERLPSFSYEPKVAIRDPAAEAEALEKKARRFKGSNKKSGTTAAGAPKVRRKVDENEFVDTSIVQPPLSSTAVLANGVIVREGADERSGAASFHMTRAQYSAFGVSTPLEQPLLAATRVHHPRSQSTAVPEPTEEKAESVPLDSLSQVPVSSPPSSDFFPPIVRPPSSSENRLSAAQAQAQNHAAWGTPGQSLLPSATQKSSNLSAKKPGPLFRTQPVPSVITLAEHGKALLQRE